MVVQNRRPRQPVNLQAPPIATDYVDRDADGLTSAHTVDAQNKSRQAGAITLVLKPFTAAELIAQIRRHRKGRLHYNPEGHRP